VKKGDGGNKKKKGAKKAPPLYDPHNRPIGGAESEQEEDQPEKGANWYERTGLRVGLVATFLALVGVAIMLRQCGLAEEANRMTRDTLRATVVWAHEIKLDRCPPTTGSRFTAWVKNAGTRPAERLRTHIQLVSSNAMCPDKPPLQRRLFEQSSVRTVEPGGLDEVNVVLTSPLSPARPYLHLFGIAEYKNSLGEVSRKSFYVRYETLSGGTYNFVYCPQSEDLAWLYNENEEGQGDACVVLPAGDHSQ